MGTMLHAVVNVLSTDVTRDMAHSYVCVTYEGVMSHMKDSFTRDMPHLYVCVTHEGVMSHMNDSFICVSHMKESCHI